MSIDKVITMDGHLESVTPGLVEYPTRSAYPKTYCTEITSSKGKKYYMAQHKKDENGNIVQQYYYDRRGGIKGGVTQEANRLANKKAKVKLSIYKSDKSNGTDFFCDIKEVV